MVRVLRPGADSTLGTGGAPPECDEGTDPHPASTKRRRRNRTSRPDRAPDSTGRLGTEPSGVLGRITRLAVHDGVVGAPTREAYALRAPGFFLEPGGRTAHNDSGRLSTLGCKAEKPLPPEGGSGREPRAPSGARASTTWSAWSRPRTAPGNRTDPGNRAESGAHMILIRFITSSWEARGAGVLPGRPGG